jgi:hypothetical protein
MEVNKGGKGTIQYFPGSLSLIVSHEQMIQYQIAALLKKLRQLREVTIENRAFLIVGPEKEFDHHLLRLPEKPTRMSARKARMYRSYAVGKENVECLDFSRITGFNGQRIEFSLERLKKRGLTLRTLFHLAEPPFEAMAGNTAMLAGLAKPKRQSL